MYIIGIDGLAGAGKDTVADILVKEGFTKIAFADALREAVAHATGFSLDLFLDRDTKDKAFKESYILSTSIISKFCSYTGFKDKIDEVIDKYSGMELSSPRDILKILGTEIGRKMLSPTIWIDAYKRKIKDKGRIVTPDARFSNERNAIKELGGLVFYIDRPGLETSDSHISENDKWPLDKYDVIVHNTSMFELKRGIRMWWSLNGSNR